MSRLPLLVLNVVDLKCIYHKHPNDHNRVFSNACCNLHCILKASTQATRLATMGGARQMPGHIKLHHNSFNHEDKVARWQRPIRVVIFLRSVFSPLF